MKAQQNGTGAFQKFGECLYRYSNGVYYARIRVEGKEIKCRALAQFEKAASQCVAVQAYWGMKKKPNRPGIPRDVNQNAARIVALSTGQPVPDLTDLDEKRLRRQAASILGKLGGSKGGKERAKRLTAEQRSDIARKAAAARWSDKS